MIDSFVVCKILRHNFCRERFELAVVAVFSGCGGRISTQAECLVFGTYSRPHVPTAITTALVDNGSISKSSELESGLTSIRNAPEKFDTA